MFSSSAWKLAWNASTSSVGSRFDAANNSNRLCWYRQANSQQQSIWSTVCVEIRFTNMIKCGQDDTMSVCTRVHCQRLCCLDINVLLRLNPTFLNGDLNACLAWADQRLIWLDRLIKQLDEQRTRLLVLVSTDCRHLNTRPHRLTYSSGGVIFHSTSHTQQMTFNIPDNIFSGGECSILDLFGGCLA